MSENKPKIQQLVSLEIVTGSPEEIDNVIAEILIQAIIENPKEVT